MILKRTLNIISAILLFFLNFFAGWINYETYIACNFEGGRWITVWLTLPELIILLLINLSGMIISVLQIQSKISIKIGISLSSLTVIISYIIAIYVFN
jgi:hypothetical protein